MNPRQFVMEAADGTLICCYEWPVEEPDSIVQLVHGGAEHAARYQHFAQALNEHGYLVLAEDHRGHGETAVLGKGLGNMGGSNSLAAVCSDVVELTSRAKVRYPNLPIVIFGHSIGSLTTQRVLISNGGDYAAAILSGSPSVDVLQQAKPLVDKALAAHGRDAPAEELQMQIFSAFLDKIDNPRTPFDWLSRDPLEVDKYIEDPMCGFALSIGAWQDIIEAASITTDPEAMADIPGSLPILIISGQEDPAHLDCTATEQICQRYQQAGLQSVETRYYPGARHELLNETNRQEVIEDLFAWIATAILSGRNQS